LLLSLFIRSDEYMIYCIYHIGLRMIWGLWAQLQRKVAWALYSDPKKVFELLFHRKHVLNGLHFSLLLHESQADGKDLLLI
jgi:hypothetical protein